MECPNYNNLLKLEFNNLLAEAQRCYGGISSRHLKKSLDVVQSAIATFGRVFALRVDLRCANDAIDERCDMPLCFQRNDQKVITRFIAALNSRIKADLQRKGKSGKPDYPLYIWVRERDTSKYAHYHLVLFFNKDIYGYLGCYQNSDGENMGTRIQKAWWGDFVYIASMMLLPQYKVSAAARGGMVMPYWLGPNESDYWRK
ncbi:YagK/YfjJ domain-containing protein [Aeromonas sp. 102P]|uniref:YagK/YfjJ domain-containing protein n=1 Tax=Aeromonas sp. 102P TaxID=3452711 RepID=UPI003F78E91A